MASLLPFIEGLSLYNSLSKQDAREGGTLGTGRGEILRLGDPLPEGAVARY